MAPSFKGHSIVAFSCTMFNLTSRKFFYAGMLAAVSLANGGPGLNCLSKTVYTYLCHGLKVYSRLKSHPRS